MTAPREIIRQVNATRARYGWAPIIGDEEQAVIEERRCDQIALMWVRMGKGLDEWKSSCPELVELFAGEIEYRRGRISLCDVVDTWEEDYGLNRDDFIRLRREIESWIVVHSAHRKRN